MKVLHILKSEPDATVQTLREAIDREATVSTVHLYQGETDWAGLVEAIFTSDRVICWW